MKIMKIKSFGRLTDEEKKAIETLANIDCGDIDCSRECCPLHTGLSEPCIADVARQVRSERGVDGYGSN